MRSNCRLLTMLVWLLFLPVFAATELPEPLQVWSPSGKAHSITKMDESGSIDDRTFLRRIWLDLAGVNPPRTQMEAFLANSSANKREQVIDQLLASPQFVERWTTFFGDLFLNHDIFGNGIYRNAFHDNLKTMVATNTPWDEMARRIISATGYGEDPESATFFWIRGAVEEEFRLDYLDDQIAWITDTMLGVKTECISCHDGAYHLEEVNVGLAKMTREQFWGMAAFLSKGQFFISFEDQAESEDDTEIFFRKLQLVETDGDKEGLTEGYFIPFGSTQEARGADGLPKGEYEAVSKPGQGMRPARNSGLIKPTYLFTGEQPRANETRRQALARMITNDRQFARSMVNRIWVHMFGLGFIDTQNGWDMARINNSVALANQSTVQPRNAFLMEFLTDWFRNQNYDMRALLRLIANSKLYQWNYAVNEPGAGGLGDDDPWAYWRDNARLRRIDAESIVDNFFGTLGLEGKYLVTGRGNQIYTSAWQLPSPDEPSFIEWNRLMERAQASGESLDSYLANRGLPTSQVLNYYQFMTPQLLRQFGRGNFEVEQGRNNDSHIQNTLFLMNDDVANFWLYDDVVPPLVTTLVQALEQETVTQEDLVTWLVRDILFRDPLSTELNLMKTHFQEKNSGQAVRDLIWVLLNHPDAFHR